MGLIPECEEQWEIEQGGEEQREEETETPTKYTVRGGTVDSGKDYEFKMGTLLSLRCVNQNFHDFWLASNAEGTGAFDDLILQVRDRPNESKTFMLQAKHKDSGTPVLEQAFLPLTTSKTAKPPKSDFLLSKYSKDIDKLHEKVNSKEKEKIIKDLGNFDNIYFILFTNRGINTIKKEQNNLKQKDKYQFLEQHNNDKYLACLNTASKSEGSVFKVNLDKASLNLNSANANKFFFLANQVNIKRIDELIVEEIKKVLPWGLNQVNLEGIAETFSKFVMDWAKGKLGGHYYLKKQDVVSKLTELLLGEYEVNLRPEEFTSYSSQTKRIWNKIVFNKTIVVVEAVKGVWEFLLEYLGSEVGKYCNWKIVGDWGDKLTTEEQNSFYQNSKLKTQMLKIVGNNGKFSLLDIYKSAWVAKKLPLLLEIIEEHQYKNILQILNLSSYSFKVIVLKKEGVVVEHPDDLEVHKFETLEDLKDDRENLKTILGQSVKIQGRSSAILRDLIDENMFPHLKSADVINILLRNFNVGRELKPLPDYFIRRTVIKKFVLARILQENPKEIFLIENWKEHLDSLPIDKTRVSDLEKVDFDDLSTTINIFTIQDGVSHEQLEKLTKVFAYKKPIHRLSFFDSNHLEWKETHGSKKSLKLYQVKLENSLENTVTDKFFSAANIVSAHPGMGKTFLMDYIARTAPTDKWVLRIDLIKHQQPYKNDESKKTDATIALKYLKYFYEKTQDDSELTYAIFLKFAKSKNIVVLLDGFDEVSWSYKDEVRGLAESLWKEGYHMWLTTRPIMKEHLEETFKTSLVLKPFTVEDQKEFLLKYFWAKNPDLRMTHKGRLVLDKFFAKLLDAVKKNFNEKDSKFTEIPLHAELLADAFQDKCWDCLHSNQVIFDEKFDLLDLYERFLDKKLEISCGKYGKGQKDTHDVFKEQLALSALTVIFDVEHEVYIKRKLDDYNKEEQIKVLQKDGVTTVNENNKVTFVHLSFAEYFAARWLSENMQNKDEEVKELADNLIKERFTKNSEYKFLFSFFDAALAKGCPLHLAIIKGQKEDIKKLIGRNPETVKDIDKGGRTIWHMVALYGFQYPLPYEKYHRSEFENFEQLSRDVFGKIRINKRIDVEVDFMGYSPLDYALTNCSLTIANEIYTLSRTPITIIRANIDLNHKTDYFEYCADLGYRSLFELLLPYFVSKDLLLTKTLSPNTKIKDYYPLKKIYLDQTLPELLKKLTLLELVQNKSGVAYSRYEKTNCFQGNYRDIRYAIVLGTQSNVKQLLNTEEIDKQDNFQNSPLHYAILHRKVEIVKMLLYNGANLNKRNNSNTPLHLAFVEYDKTVVKFLLNSKRVKINARNREGNTILHLAVQRKYNGNKEKALLIKGDSQSILKIILSCCADARAFLHLVNNRGETALHCAVINKHDDFVTYLLDAQAEIDKQEDDGNTSLHLAVITDHFAITNLLINKGANLNLKNKNGLTPLHIACDKARPAIIQALVLKGANVCMGNRNGNTPLHYIAAMINQIELAKLLIDRGANVSAPNKIGNTPLHWAITNNYTENAQLLVEKGADMNKRNENGDTPLHLAIRNDHEGATKLLIENEAEVDVENNDGDTPLHLASEQGKTNLAELLVNRIKLLFNAANVINIKNKNGNTPQHFASKEGHGEIVDLLINNKADIDLGNNDGNTSLHVALENDYLNVVQLILDNKANVDKQNDNGDTPLHVVLMKGCVQKARTLPLHVTCVLYAQLFLKTQANINITNKNGDTPLHIALKQGCKHNADLLIFKGATVKKANKDGNTPLHLTLIKGYEDLAEIIISKGANVDNRNLDGNTPLYIAIEKGFIRCAELLLDYDVNVNVRNNNNSAPLHLIISSDLVKVNEKLFLVKSLLSKGAYTNIKDKDGNTPLNFACMEGYSDIVKVLLENKANVNVENKYGNTPLISASINGNVNIIKSLLDSGAISNSKNHNGDTALHLSLRKGFTQNAILLINNGAKVNAENKNGNTPLHLTLTKNYTHITELILAKRINFNEQNESGDTPLHLAIRKDYQLDVEFLIENKVNIDTQNNNGDGPLHLAVARAYVHLANCLVFAGADINQNNKFKNTPLHLAAEKGKKVLVNFFIKNGANVSVKNADGNTPLDLAILKGHKNIVSLLQNNGDVKAEGVSGNISRYLTFRDEMKTTDLPNEDDVDDIDVYGVDGNTPRYLTLKDKIKTTELLTEDDTDICSVDGNTSLYLLRDDIQITDDEVEDLTDSSTSNETFSWVQLNT